MSNKNILEQLQQIHWRLIVSFRTELLTEYLIQSNLAKAQSLLTLPQSKRLIVDNDIYLERAETEKLEATIGEDIRVWSKKLFDQIESMSKALLKRSQKLNKQNVQNFSNQELTETLRSWLEHYGTTVSLIGFPARLDEVLERALRVELSKYDIEDSEAVFRVIAHSDKWTGVFEEKLALMKAVLDGTGSELWIEEHVNKYGWITITLLLGDGYLKQQVQERISELRQEQNLQEKYDELANNIAENKKDVQALLKRYDFSFDTRELISLFRHAIWFRTARLDWMNEVCILARPILNEVARRIGVSYEQCIYHLPDELLQSLREEKSVIAVGELEQRLGQYAMATVDGLHTELLLGSDVDELKKVLTQSSEKAEAVKGMIAYPGVVQGRVKVLKDRSELHKVEKGDVLVTKLTTPDFVLAMEKAAAIVTDLGGITSHAAIVSRELHIPCIIGTKIATQVLKDGDVVEVDADKGIVRKLS